MERNRETSFTQDVQAGTTRLRDNTLASELGKVARLADLWRATSRGAASAGSIRRRVLRAHAVEILGCRLPSADERELDWMLETFSREQAALLYLAACELADGHQLVDAFAVIEDACRAQRGHEAGSATSQIITH
jgi:hypothetical protein